MKRSFRNLGLTVLVLASIGWAQGTAKESPVDRMKKEAAQRAVRYQLWETQFGTLLLDSSTGHSWRLEFSEKTGYVWSQIPRGMMKDDGFPIENPMTGK
ncbi:MAG: hypothetical protein AAGD14_04925 [Planctomycetota bacterium]